MNFTGLERGFRAFFLLMFSLLTLAGAKADIVVEETPAEVFAEPSSISLDRPFWIAFQIRPKAGHYVPYFDPETGAETVIADFGLPEGFQKGQILYSIPKALFGGETYGYSTPFWILQEIIPTHEAEFQESYTFPGQATWVDCLEGECSEHEQEVSISLPFGPGFGDINTQDIFAKARQTLAAPMPWPAQYSAGAGNFELVIYTQTPKKFETATLLLRETSIDPNLSSKLSVEVLRDRVVFSGSLDGFVPKATLRALLMLPGEAYDLAQRNTFETEKKSGNFQSDLSEITFWMAFLLAFIGGMILNLMPCVFPVLTLKLFGLVRAGGISPKAMRVDGLFYTLGILMTFLLLALVFLTLREAGQQVGWGFQLQSPFFVLVLGLILFLVTLNFAGFFDLKLPFAIGVGPKKEGALGSFYTGMLATVLATPCTAPFMSTALGFALTLSTLKAITVFMGLGLGMALPYFAVTLIPKIQRIFPKPGPWMSIFKKILAIPLALTVGWLGSILFAQVGWPGVLIFVILAGILAFFIYLWKKMDGIAFSHKIFVFLIATGIFLGVGFTSFSILETKTVKIYPEGADVVKWDEGALWNAQLQGKGVFVNYTATWCLTCLVNEKMVFNREKFQRFLAEKNIIYMEADWTNYDPKIGESLEKLGRSALPVYIFYPPGGPTKEPVFLPEILTLDQAMDIILANS